MGFYPTWPPLAKGRKNIYLVRYGLMALCLLVGVSDPADAEAPAATEPPFLVRFHDIRVQLFPHEHRIQVFDRMTLQATFQGHDRIAVTLNPSLRIDRVHLQTPEGQHPVSFRRIAAGEANLVVQLPSSPASGQEVVLEWEYGGAINDPPKEPRQLRFVTPSETAGHIGDEGVYLSGETQWYPDMPGQLPAYRVTVTVPQGWKTVSHGRQVERMSSTHEGLATLTEVWDVSTRTEALTLVANRFVKGKREWKGIEIATYLFPEDATLSDEYLDAAIRYLEVYTHLLGPYPFPKFAVVENFFASGLGMPSFTLLGSGVIKRHYVQPYALGHEIVHSWFGNSVFNDSAQGNWVEGLTTYLANYYYDELKGTADQARDHRRMMLLGYAVYVKPDEDYPVGRFTHKSDQKDNAIGYQKAAMIFHMLREEIGEEAFWLGIKRLVAERTGSYATWLDVEGFLSRAAGRNLRWFFQQWVERAGSPAITVEKARSRAQENAVGGFTVEVVVRQREPVFRFQLPVSVSFADGRIKTMMVQMNEAKQSFTISVPTRPVRLRLDPEWAVFRRVDRTQLPPMLNLFVTDRQRLVVTPGGGEERERMPYEHLADRLMAQDAGGQASGTEPRLRRLLDRDAMATDALEKGTGSVLILGPLEMNQAVEWAAANCAHHAAIGDGRFTVMGHTYEQPDHALLLSCRHPARPEHIVTLFFAHSPAVAAKVGRLLFFYGWQSYLVFQDGAVIARGDFTDTPSDLEVVFDGKEG